MSIALVAGTMAWAAINPDAAIATDPSRILSAGASAAAGTVIASAPLPYERMPDRQAGAAHPASPLPVSGMPTVVARDTELASLDQPGGLAALSDPGAEELRNWVDERLEELRNGRERGLAGREEPAVAGDMVKEKIVVRRGDTLMDILLRAGIPRAEAHEALTSLEEVYDPRKLRVGQHLDIELERAAENPDGTKLSMLSINLDFSNDLRLARAPEGGFDVRQTERELVRHTVTASSVIDNSLYLAARQAGVGDDALMELIRLFSWDVDFQHDVHTGDAFSIAYEEVATPDGAQSRVDHLIYASLSMRGRALEAYRFRSADGMVGYYDSTGKSLRKWLMRTPVDGARLSSGFGKRRHPILGYTRMHKGVDFAASAGTPIYAAGDGVIAEIGRKGSYGNYIRIRHNGEYSTAYAHMKGFAKGLKRGVRVGQGDVIGYVGSTGRSTGPHLHYEVLENGQQINPMKVKKQVVTRLEGSDLQNFRRRVSEVVALMDDAEDARRVVARNAE